MFKPSLPPEERRLKRCFQRVASGLEKGGDLRFGTLTSSDEAKRPIKHDFARIVRYLRRQGVLNDYIKVIEVKSDGREHVHLIFRGGYIAQSSLSNLWDQIHQSPIVDIRRVRKGRSRRRGLARELAKYMVKDIHRQYSWSRNWVYSGFVKTWLQALRIYRLIGVYALGKTSFPAFLKLWQTHLRSRSPPERFLNFLGSQLQLVIAR